jgi:hypothetical protein
VSGDTTKIAAVVCDFSTCEDPTAAGNIVVGQIG